MTISTIARVCIAPRSADLTITADAALDERLHDLDWTGAEPTVREDDGGLDVGYRFRGRLAALAGGTLALRLSPAYTWEIELDGGVSNLRADLRGLRVGSLLVRGGASDVEIDLPAPEGELPLRIEGGASKAIIRRPGGVPVAVEIDGGASRLRLDDEMIGAIGGKVRLGAADGDDRVALRITGGASRLTVAQT